MTQPHWPPLDGSLTVIPGFLDFHAERHPERAWALFPSRTDPTQAESISFGEFAKASHRFAHLVRPGRAGKDGEVVTLLIHCDTILYLAVLTGLIRAGIVVRAEVSLLKLLLRCSIPAATPSVPQKLPGGCRQPDREDWKSPPYHF